MIEAGKKYYFWNSVENKAVRITIVQTRKADFSFYMGGHLCCCRYDGLENAFYESPDEIPQIRAANCDDDEIRGNGPREYNNLVGFEHADFSGTGYKYYPSIYYYQGHNDQLEGGSVFDEQDYEDSCDE